MRSSGLKVWPRDTDRYLLLLAAVFSVEMFLIRGNIGLNLGDEGFLWYGADRVFRGEVPIRDFVSYDPGRYYWTALFFKLWRPGIIPLRLAQAFLQWGGLFAALLAAKRASLNRWELAALGLTLTLWMYPVHHYIDCAMPMLAVYLGCRLLEEPGARAAAAAGALMGLAAFVGRNHALYVGASLGVLLVARAANSGGWRRDLRAWALGLVVGLGPLLAMLAFVRGFFAAYVDTVARVFRLGRTNLGLPYPWIWEFHRTSTPGHPAVVSFILRVLFLAIPLSYAYALFKKRLRLEPLALACALVGAAYFHYVVSRADFEHLTVGISPFWLGLAALAKHSPLQRRAVLGAALAVSLAAAGIPSRLYDALRPAQSYRYEYLVSGDKLLLDSYTMDLLDGVKRAAGPLHPDEPFLALPQLPGAYVVLGRRSPVREVYTIFPAGDDEQREMIAGIERSGVRRAVIDNGMVDGREGLRFMNTNPLVWKYLGEHFQRIYVPYLPGEMAAFSR